ncbi:MAG: DNA-binding protein [Bacteroides sp.]|nr:DNA-binding protein [Bacteroides sp.]
MSVPVSVVARRNPAEKDAPFYYYGVAQSSRPMDFDELCRRAAEGRTITQADISASLYALEKVAQEGLMNGEIIRLGNLGSLRIGIRTDGVEQREKFHVLMVRSARIYFRPGPALLKMLRTLDYHKVDTRSKTVPPPDDNGGDGSEEI